jgi:hypothetical protein
MNKQKITISTGTEFGTVKKLVTDWGKLARNLSTHKQVDQKGGAYFVGGYFSGAQRKEVDLQAMSVLSLDVDKVALTVDEIELSLMMSIDGAFVAYSTYSHGVGGRSSVRVVMPLSREVTPDEYRRLSRKFGEGVALPLDECSFKPNQAMFAPTCRDLSMAWSIVQEGGPVDVGQYLSSFPVVVDEADDLETMLSEAPLEIDQSEIDGYLSAFPASGTDYNQWVMVGAALHHQFGGSDEGLAIWDQWSSDDAQRYDAAAISTKWRSFGRSNAVVTFASVIYAAKEAGGFAASGSFEALLEGANSVETLDQYSDYKERVAAMSGAILQDDQRAMLAARIANGFGKEVGITKGDIKKALAPRKKPRDVNATIDGPSWLEDWVYCETTMEFVNTRLDYAIKREAFNAKFDREGECVTAEMSASQYALNAVKIKTVVDVMYWPGASRLFEHEGKAMLNTHVDRGVKPLVPVEGSGVINRFLQHVALVLPDEREREILLDWMCFVCQNPGQRVNWALLLQGAQGTGKTYFVNVLQAVLGRNVSNLDPSSIAGRFTGWAHGSTVVAIEEIRISGTNKYEILDRMKPFLTNETVSIEEKGRDHRTVPNFSSYFLLTNHADAIPIGVGDRRYCVLYSDVQSEGQLYDVMGGKEGNERYFDDLFGDINSERGAGELAWYLKNRQVSCNFSPRGRAPETKARQAMINLSVSPDRQLLEDAIAEHECCVINGDILDVTWLNEMCKMGDSELPKTRTISAILLDMGYVQIDQRRVKIKKDRRNHYIWYRRGFDQSVAIERSKGFHDDPHFAPF